MDKRGEYPGGPNTQMWGCKVPNAVPIMALGTLSQDIWAPGPLRQRSEGRIMNGQKVLCRAYLLGPINYLAKHPCP